MARRGRTPTPSALRILTGNPQHRPLTAREPQIEAGAPEPPFPLSAEAAGAWTRMVPILVSAGIATALDSHALALHCETWSRWRALEAVLPRDGALTTGGRLDPRFKMWSELLTQWRMLAAELGLTPAARSRLRVPVRPSSSPKVDEFRRRHGDDPGCGA